MCLTVCSVLSQQSPVLLMVFVLLQQKRQSMERAQSTMRDSLTLLEREGRMGREDLSTVLNAEITTRWV